MTGMKPFTKLLSFEEALQVAMHNISPIGDTETLGLDDSTDRVIARDVVSSEEVPRFDRAAMDGYAVIAEDTYGATEEEPAGLKLVGTLHAADLASRRMEPGECIQVATGSPLPEGADSVMMVEYTDLEGEWVQMFRPLHPGANVSRRGEDMKRGQRVVAKGDIVTPSKIGVLAALGIEEVEVFQRPRVAIVPTGDEIAEVGSKLEHGQIYDINSHTVASLIKKNGGLPMVLGQVPDEAEALAHALDQALAYEIVVFSGGSSVGEKDLVNGIFSARGRILFHGVQIKPGKPILFAVIDDRPVFSMPGHPTSCLSSSYFFLVPCLRKLARMPPRREGLTKARLAKRLVCTLGRKQFVTVRLEGGTASVAFKKSSAITSMSAADGYIVVPENVESIEKGQEVEVTLFAE